MDTVKKILLVYPHNFLQGGMGQNVRVLQIVNLLKRLGYSIDQLGYENYMEGSSFENFSVQNKESIIENLYVYDCGKDMLFNNRIMRGCKRIVDILSKKFIRDWSTPGVRKCLKNIIETNNYCAVVTNYTYLGYLIASIGFKGKKICFLDDCAYYQQFTTSSNRIKKMISVGKLLESDLHNAAIYDFIYCISFDEYLFYKKYLGNKVKFLPHIMPSIENNQDVSFGDKTIDVFYLGYNNEFNRCGINWFLEEVCPYIKEDVRILLGGSVTKSIKCHNNNIEIEHFIKDINSTYNNSKVVICPMFDGTGMKTKVVEAMERGIPVVCTERGVDGLPDKTMSGCFVTDNPYEFANYINLLVEDESFYSEASRKIYMYYRDIFDVEKYEKEIRNDLTS